ncbi:MAG: SpoIIE family protein phosphatase [Acutalibacteraceae bacterium]
MTNLCADIGYRSAVKFGEQMCGDHIDVVDQKDGSSVIVLADGLGSGVKAGILSTLTSKMISTMMAKELPLDECVTTIAKALPICSERHVAYSTFTIIRLIHAQLAEIIQYDNPLIILLRNGKNLEFPKSELEIDGKKVYYSKIVLCENDVFVSVSDGCTHAGIGAGLPFGWERDNIITFLEDCYSPLFTAKAITTLLYEECMRIYNRMPKDDTTICTVRIRKSESLNVAFGPPTRYEDDEKMMKTFFDRSGKHIVCGGTTSTIASHYLKKPLVVENPVYIDPDVPPVGKIEGIDLVTEGVLTISKVLMYARDYLGENKLYSKWSCGTDGASLISRMMFIEATDIHFIVGQAINPAHQSTKLLPVSFNIKMQLVSQLSKCLKKMGKTISINYM